MGYPCPCCGYLTLSEPSRGTYEICPVCYWEDDQAQFIDSALRGGANNVSLNEARKSFASIGASQEKFLSKVRAPSSAENL